MSMTDPIADMITRIRNAVTAQKDEVRIPASGIKKEILQVLKDEGFVTEVIFKEDKRQGILTVKLKYGTNNERVINGIERVSKPGRRIYKSSTEIQRFRGGLVFSILSTNKGVMTDRDSMKNGVGGEVLINVW